MNNELQQAKEDLAYMKSLVREDLRVSLVIGIVFQTAGMAGALGALWAWALSMGWHPPSPLSLISVWHLAVLSVAVVVFRLLFLTRRRPGILRKEEAAMRQSGLAARASMAGWHGAIMGYVVSVASLEISGVGSPPVYVVILCAFWGGGWSILHCVTRIPWHMTMSFCSYLAALLFAATQAWAPSLSQLTIALVLFLLFGLPGTLMLADKKRGNSERNG